MRNRYELDPLKAVAYGTFLALFVMLPLRIAFPEESPIPTANPFPLAPLPKHALPEAPGGSLVVGNCDGRTAIEVPGKKPGDRLSDPEAREVSRKLMVAWRTKNPGVRWVSTAEAADEKAKAADNVPAQRDLEREKAEQAKQQQGVYSKFTPEDRKAWELEQARAAKAGSEIFHSAEKLGSKTAISCDMCHPNAANTHPETYPKYQVQLQRVALLRDMINWCIENPIKGKPLADGDPAMRAMEAYILSQRKGVALDPGKH